MNARQAQDQTIRQILLDLEMVSNGTIYSYAPVGSKTGFSGSPPTSGDHDPAHVRYRVEYNRADTDQRRDSVIRLARGELESLTCTAPAPTELKPETKDERDKRILKFGTGLGAQQVATTLRVPVSEVKRARREAGQDPETGERLPDTPEGLSDLEKRRKAVEMKQRHPNASFRLIGDRVGLDHKTVRAAWEEAA